MVVAAFAACILGGRRRQRQSTPAWLGTWRSWRTRTTATKVSIVTWSVLIGGAVAWDTVSFAAQSHAFPTLSDFIGHVTRHEVGRGALFALWLAFGAYAAVGHRRKAGEPH